MPENTIFVKPAAGMRVVNPATGQPLPAEGEVVENGTYWIRRLDDADVTQEEMPVAVEAAPDAAAADAQQTAAKTKKADAKKE